MVHGFAVDHIIMEEALEPLFVKDDSFLRIYVDLPGMGESDPLPDGGAADEVFTILSDFMATFCGGEPYGLVGYSYGGYLIRRFIREIPGRILGAFFICPVVYPLNEDRTLPPFEKRRSDPSLKELDAHAYGDYSGLFVLEDRYSWDMYHKTLRTVLAGANRAFLGAYRKNGYSYTDKVDPPPVPFSRPAAFLLGKQDHVVGYEDTFSLLSGYSRADLLLLDDAGHNLIFEQPGEFRTFFRKWLIKI